MRFIAYAVLVIAAAVLAVLVVLRQSLPAGDDAVRIEGLQAEATLRYDQWQRPFVEAANLADALAVQGWLHATHRLWQMEMLRRAGQGRLAEMLGVDLVETDEQLWRAGVPQLAKKLEANAAAGTLKAVDAYLAGVNGAIGEMTLAAPEFLLLRQDKPRWVRRDVFALGALMAHQSANNMSNELLRLSLAQVLDPVRMSAFLTDDSASGHYPFVLASELSVAGLRQAMDRLALTDPATNPLMPRLGFGSNGWVISGARSTSGAPLFAFDSHDELGLPNLFYEVHLFFADKQQLRGWSVPGLPGVINGFNQDVAWGFTNIGDTQDLFVETRSPTDPLLFRFGGEWERATIETVDIPVRGGAARRIEIVHTRNGPLVSEEPALSLAWTVHRIERPSLDSMLQFNLAADWPAFTEALDTFPAPTLNATYADRHGTIGFRTAGVLPRRGAGSGLFPQDGSDPSAVWQGLVDAADMPERSNPEEHYLAAANARVNAAGDGPLVSADNAAPYRIQRIQNVLGGDELLSLNDMQALQMDWTDGQAQMVLPSLLDAVGGQALTPVAAQARELLLDWAGKPVATADSAAALVFQSWYIALAAVIYEEPLGELYPQLLRRAYLLNHSLDHLLLVATDSPWWRGQRNELIANALESAVAQLAESLGVQPRNWQLAQRQHVELRHPLGSVAAPLSLLFDIDDVPWGGSVSTVGRARYSYARPFAVNAGATVRMVAEMGEVPTVQAVIPGGQSGHPLSPHYADQYDSWLAGELLPVAAFPAALGNPGVLFTP